MFPIAAFDASSEKSLGAPSAHEEHAVPAVLGLAVRREEDLNVECEEAVRVVVRVRARPAERAYHTGGLPIEGIGGRVKMGVVKTTVWGRPHQHVIESIWESS